MPSTILYSTCPTLGVGCTLYSTQYPTLLPVANGRYSNGVSCFTVDDTQSPNIPGYIISVSVCPSPTPTPSPTSTVTPSITPTVTATPTITSTTTPTPTNTPSITPTITNTPTNTPTQTPTPTKSQFTCNDCGQYTVTVASGGSTTRYSYYSCTTGGSVTTIPIAPGGSASFCSCDSIGSPSRVLGDGSLSYDGPCTT